MGGEFEDRQANLRNRRRRMRERQGIVGLLAGVVVVATAIALMVPAVSMTNDDLDEPQAVQSIAAEQLAVQEEEGASESAADEEVELVVDEADAEPEVEPEADSEPEGDSPAEAAEETVASGSPAHSSDDTAEAVIEDPGPEPVVEPEEEADSAPAEGVSPQSEKADSATMPAQSFYGELRDKKDQVTLAVNVEAPEGALHAGAAMQVQAVKPKAVKDAIQDALDAEDAGKLQAVQAVDITFVDADGVEVGPAAPVSVKFASPQIAQATEAEANEPLVAHIDAEGKAVLVDVLTDKQLAKRDIQREDDELLFDADSFSVYAVVYTVDFSYMVDGESYQFTLKGEDSVSLRDVIAALHVHEKWASLENADVASSDENAEDANAVGKLAGDDAVLLDRFVRAIASVDFTNPRLLGIVKLEEDMTLGELCFANGWIQGYSLFKPQKEVEERNAVQYLTGDWVLVSLQPFDTEETLTIAMDDGEFFSIEVTDAQDAVMNDDGTVQTISNPAGTTIDLFDYWVLDAQKDTAGRAAWGGWNGDGWSTSTQSENAGNVMGGGNSSGINAGHMFKFSPAWAGTVQDGTLNSATSDGRHSINSWTKSADPTQGLVVDSLVGGYPKLTNNGALGTNGESLRYLFDPATDVDGEGQNYQAGKKSYPGVDQLLYVDKDGYYTYDSRDCKADFSATSNEFTLTPQTSNNTEVRGFWPFGQQKFWVGMHINTQFSMPDNGEVLNPAGVNLPMEFEFSGDDDVWIYIDGVLVGDGGGIHNKTHIIINFQDGTVNVTGKDDPDHTGTFEKTLYLSLR